MKVLFATVILIIVNWFAIAPLIPKVDEADIGKNIRSLKKQQWFKKILCNEKYRKLIIYDNDVRKTIGKFNYEKLDKRSFSVRYQRKLQKLIQKKQIN